MAAMFPEFKQSGKAGERFRPNIDTMSSTFGTFKSTEKSAEIHHGLRTP